MTYTLNNIPDEIDRAIRARAEAEHKSPEQAILDALARDLGVSAPPKKHRDLSDIAGTWEEDPETEAILEEQRQIDPEMWPEAEVGPDGQVLVKRRDLSDVAGKCSIDDETRAVFEDLRRIDPEMWK